MLAPAYAAHHAPRHLHPWPSAVLLSAAFSLWYRNSASNQSNGFFAYWWAEIKAAAKEVVADVMQEE